MGAPEDPDRTQSSGLATSAPSRAEPPRPCLIVAWIPKARDRTGEVLMAPVGAWRMFGRGRPRDDDPHPRAVLGRLRPGVVEPTGPIDVSTVSRLQLRLRVRAAVIDVENRGRLPLVWNGRTVTGAEVRPGDVLALGDEVLLYCDHRRPQLDQVAVDGPTFGEADRFGLVGESPAAWALREDLAFVGARDRHALVLGESGTGKELAARALHAMSGRASGPFVARNAATLPDGLVDAELFGNIKGYPNPGMPARPGLVGGAHTGTLFLDEIAELPEALQSHLLRLLDDGEYHRLGDTRASRADLRVVGATNRPIESLKHDVRARFPLRVSVPSLAARRADLPLLVQHLLRRAAASDADIAERFFTDGEPRVTVGFMAWALRQDWPGNVRELEAALWRVMAERKRGELHYAWAAESRAVAWDLGMDAAALPPEHVQACLDHFNGVQEEVWRALGLPNRFALRRLIRRHGLLVRKAR
ncbi:MAG: sigma 54-interacting transcriptional regulator [Myxococcota bacterium]